MITREPEQAAGIIARLAEYGITGIAFPVTRTEVIVRLDSIPNPDDFNSVLFTSPRSVTIAADIFHSAGKDLPRSSRVVAVGSATMKVVKERFLRSPDLVGNAGGETLANLIKSQFGRSASPMLWPSAKETASDLAGDLLQKGIVVEKWSIYETLMIENEVIADNLEEIGEVEAIFFAAPSAVNSLSRIKKMIIKPGVAIGDSTARAMAANGWQQIFTAKSPTEAACVAAILQSLENSTPNVGANYT